MKELTFEFDPRHGQQIKLPTNKPVYFKWSLTGKPDPFVIKTNIRQKGYILDAVNFTDEPATLTVQLPE